MDHVNIISQEAIMTTASWYSNIICVFGFLIIGFMIGCLIYNTRIRGTKQERTLFGVVLWVGCIGLCVLLILAIIGGIFFRVPSGRYRYEATIDEQNMTVAEYNEFMKAYSHSKCTNGIYYFEDWIE